MKDTGRCAPRYIDRIHGFALGDDFLQDKREFNYVYILKCSDASFYTGWTNNLEKRLAAHNSGKGAKYTRTRLPVELVYYEAFESKSEAMSREWHIKRLTRQEKCELIQKQTGEAEEAHAYSRQTGGTEEA
ncbi:MAG: GIY-YIG nuclease family protein [Lachnospiraceae bacterium]|nr:GIY-YIG nuclease family protein [Lachnospiraceae bacterium]